MGLQYFKYGKKSIYIQSLSFGGPLHSAFTAPRHPGGGACVQLSPRHQQCTSELRLNFAKREIVDAHVSRV